MNYLIPLRQLWAGLSSERARRIRFWISREGIFLVLYMAASAMVLNVFMQTRSLEEGSKSFGLAVMLDGTAERPYVYRQLIPIIANYAANLIPETERHAFVQYHLDKYHLRQQYFGRAKYTNQNIESWTPSYAIKFHVVYLADFFSLLGLAYMLRFLAGAVMQSSQHLELILPIMFLLILPMSFMHGDFFYDFPELFLLGGLLLSLIKGNYTWWIILLPIAVLNKESNVLVPLLYLPVIISSENSNKWRNNVSIVLAILASVATYFYVKYLFSDNPGGTTIWQLWKNVNFWSSAGSYFLWHDYYAPLILFPRGMNILFISFLAVFLGIAWHRLSKQIKELFMMALLINIPLWLLFCHYDELRNLSFIFLPTFLIASHSLNQLLTRPSSLNGE